MAEYERIPEPKDKLGEFQKKYNFATKSAARLLGTNVALFVCILLPILLIGFIWTDFGIPTVGTKFVSESIVTVALFVIGEIMMSKIGSDGGKLDPDYIDARKEFLALVNQVNGIGTTFMNLFCDWQIDLEMEHATLTRLRAMQLTPSDWDKLKDMPKAELVERYGKRRAKDMMALKELEPIELNEAILLYDSSSAGMARGGVPISGEGYLHKKTHSPKMILSAIFTGLLTVSVAITLTSDISWARVVYTAFKLVVLLYRMAVGYSLGAKAYNSIEVGQLQAKCNYLRQYIRFINEKTYLKLGDRYKLPMVCTEDGRDGAREEERYIPQKVDVVEPTEGIIEATEAIASAT